MKPQKGKAAVPETPVNSEVAEIPAKLQQALELHQQGKLPQARTLYQQIVALQPRHFVALHLLGVSYSQAGNPQKALDLIDSAIAIKPDYAEACSNRGNALRDLGQADAALASYDRAIAIKPDYAEAHYNRANALRDLNRLDAALAGYDRALAFKPDYAEACYNRGVTLQELKLPEAAVASYDRAIALRPGYAEACYNRGNALRDLQRFEQALASYDLAIAASPDSVELHFNRGVTLHDLRQFEPAVAAYDRAIAIKPDMAQAHYNRGISLQDLKQMEAALASYDCAIAIKPDYAEAHFTRGNVLRELKRWREAMSSYDEAVTLRPDYKYLHGARLHAKMQICDWAGLENQIADLVNMVTAGEKATTPFPLLSLTDTLQTHRKAAEIWVEDRRPENLAVSPFAKLAGQRLAHIGYFSADFRNHPVSILMAGVLAAHDRNRFRISAFSYGPDAPRDEVRGRVASAVDEFVDVRNMTDEETSLLARNMGVDIAVDLNGHTGDARTGIFALRAAPLQVNFLGYPATMGARYMDYMLADNTIIPEDFQRFYSEKIVYLPSYQPNDATRPIAEKRFSRDELGLPETAFVFCCFNHFHKITPAVFDGWMRILKQVEGSVLWLSDGNADAKNNLKKEAALRGIDAARLVFAQRLPRMEDHLSRQRAADLFIDTSPYNAHTTASDALWAGLPVLTCMGESFASRVAASLLNAIRMPELIATTQDQYEALAVELATHPARLADIKRKLGKNRLTTALFDTTAYTRSLEAAYAQMLERHQADLPPDHFYVGR